ncbi:ferredoxin--NADP(+) reductase [Acidihalobacter aeolianus]|uniref:ferredoxin--NADP(+) reductase n=1 Tax=Acidihalobacter aeolianus TaxID=2792603 RepID=A0A1D8KCE0_9GAMM|nr:ferredoxin--NADP reductase [Acidihalobacter aeolianus]AOV18628.1 ferredoxin--NADP(+) reductase [Acidihalobacter aeolianus]
MDLWLEGRVVEKRQWTERLFTMRIEASMDTFKPGQFARIALDIDGERVARPYSCINTPDEPCLEIYYNTVENGLFTTALLSVGVDDPIWVARQTSGFFTLDEVPDAENLWMISSGTGLGVFLCLLKTEELWRRFGQVRLVHAVRFARELSYREAIDGFAAAHPGRFAYIPFVSREPVAEALEGRIPQAIVDGRLEARAGMPFDPENTQVMICGNTNMIQDTSAVLSERGMRRNRRRTPGHITTEKYW